MLRGGSVGGVRGGGTGIRFSFSLYRLLRVRLAYQTETLVLVEQRVALYYLTRASEPTSRHVLVSASAGLRS